jgi:hypothetical protein
MMLTMKPRWEDHRCTREKLWNGPVILIEFPCSAARLFAQMAQGTLFWSGTIGLVMGEPSTHMSMHV